MATAEDGPYSDGAKAPEHREAANLQAVVGILPAGGRAQPGERPEIHPLHTLGSSSRAASAKLE